MLLAGLQRRYQLIRQQNEKNYRLTQLTTKLSDLQRYASSIGDGNISMSDMMNMPSSIFGRAMTFMAYSHNIALMGAQQNMAMMTPQINLQMQQIKDANQQQMYQKWIYNNLYPPGTSNTVKYVSLSFQYSISPTHILTPFLSDSLIFKFISVWY